MFPGSTRQLSTTGNVYPVVRLLSNFNVSLLRVQAGRITSDGIKFGIVRAEASSFLSDFKKEEVIDSTRCIFFYVCPGITPQHMGRF